MKLTMKNVSTKIQELEIKYNLLDITYNNSAIWPYYRMYYYYSIMNENKIFGIAHDKANIDWRTIVDALKIIFSWKLVKLFTKRKKYIVLEHPRNKEGIDIYTQDIKDVIQDEGLYLSFTTLFKSPREGTVYLDLFKVISKIVAKIFYRFVSNPKLDSFKAFEGEMQTNKSNSFKKYYIEYIMMYHLYTLLLRYHQPKVVFVVVSYYNLALVAAARDLSIKSVELQHGVISPYHLGYDYKVSSKNYLPDFLATFGSSWSTSATFPKGLQTVELGNSYLSKERNEAKRDKTIVIVSQGVIGEALVEFIVNNIEFLKGYKLYYKLHPGEFESAPTRYKSLFDLRDKYDLEVVTTEYSIEWLQDITTIQIGVFSTAIYEGLQRGCQTIIVDLDGAEYMDALVEDGVVLKLSKDEKLNDDTINALERLDGQEETFFVPFNQKALKRFLVDSEK
jgi:hypothetical protein